MKKFIGSFLILSPLFYLIIYVSYYHVNIPWGDQWIMVFNYFRGDADALEILKKLWAPHNSHRLFFPKGIMLAMSYITNWNIFYELIVNIILAGLSFSILFLYLTRLKFELNFRFSLLLFILSVMMFSPVQWENFLWGWQIAIFLNVFTVMLGFFLLSGRSFDLKKFIFAMLLGFIGTNSFGNGLAFWPVAFFLLIFKEYESNKIKYRVIVSLIIIACVVIFAYSYGLMFNPYMEKSQGIVQKLMGEPLYFIHFYLVLLGSPVANYDPGLSAFFGVLGIIVWGGASYYILRKKITDPYLVLPVMGLGAYVLFGAILIVLGRARMLGVEPALNSRYVTITNLLWMSNLVLVYIIYSSKDVFLEKLFINKIISVFLCAFILSISASYYKGSREGRRHSKMLNLAKEHILVCHPDKLDDTLLKTLLPFTKFVRSGINILKEKELALFADASH